MSTFYVNYPPSGGGSSSNASVGLNGSPAPTSSTEIGFIDGSGNEQGVSPTNPLPVHDSAPVAPAGSATSANQVLEIAQLTGIHADTTSIDGKTPTVGQKTMAASSPVVIASDQSAIPTSTTNGATAANQTTEITAINSFAAKTAAALVAVPFDTIDLTYVGATTNIDTAIYKLGATTVRTLTLSYDGSGRLSAVVAS